MTKEVREALKKWAKETFLSEMIAASGGVLNDGADEFLDLTVESIENTRVMYDFYDSHGVFLDMTVMTNSDFIPGIVMNNNNVLEQNAYITRSAAEKAGFEKCAELLNDKLCKQK